MFSIRKGALFTLFLSAIDLCQPLVHRDQADHSITSRRDLGSISETWITKTLQRRAPNPNPREHNPTTDIKKITKTSDDDDKVHGDIKLQEKIKKQQLKVEELQKKLKKEQEKLAKLQQDENNGGGKGNSKNSNTSTPLIISQVEGKHDPLVSKDKNNGTNVVEIPHL